MEIYGLEHYPMIAKWMEGRDMQLAPKSFLPRTGFVVKDVACGFILCTGTGVCFFEYFYTNPEKSPIERGRAIEKISKELIYAAKEMGIKNIVTRVDKNGYKRMAKRLGFKEVGEFTSLVKEL